MTDLVDRVIDSLAAHHVRLAGLVERLTDEQLVAASAATEWRVCDVLSHLGSGAEIMAPTLLAGIAAEPPPAGDNQAVWDRWDAAESRDQATGFVERDAAIVRALTELTPGQRGAVMVDLGFLPEPVSLVVAAGMRLNEVALHTWDVEAGLDPTATLDAEAADVLLDLYAGPLRFLLGWIGKHDALADSTMVAAAGRSIVVETFVALEGAPPATPTAVLTAAPEAVVRLLNGRLAGANTPADVTITGNVTLDDLRRVFPGF